MEKQYTRIILTLCIAGAVWLAGLNKARSQTPVLVAENAEPEIVTEGYQFTEGPCWHPGGYLLFSDIPANTIFKWMPGEGTTVFLRPSGNSNGIAASEDGTIYLAQHAGSVSRVSDGSNTETLVERYEGKRLNSPNDLVVHSSGTIYFTDPPFGVTKESRELEFSGVYKLTSEGELTPFYREFTHPNGIALSPDESRLYVNDSQTGRIVVFEMDRNGNPVNPQDFAEVGEMSGIGAADGMKVDRDGRLYTTGPGGVYIFSPAGEQLQKISTEDRITNLAWGGENRSHLFMTAPDAVYRLKMNVEGAR